MSESMSNLLTATKRLLDLPYLLTGSGSWSLLSEEIAVTDAVVCSLEEKQRALVRSQLLQKFFVERTSPGKRVRVIRFYSFPSELKIQDASFADLLFKVRIEVDGEVQTAHVTFYRGFLFSVEFKKSAHNYDRKVITVLQVVKGEAKKSYTRSIDRHEHGAEDGS